MLTAFAYARSPSAPLGDVFFSVSVGFFQRGISPMMTFLGLDFGVWVFVLSGSLVILLPCFKSRPLIDASSIGRRNTCEKFTRGSLET
jgi:hypothetical protein